MIEKIDNKAIMSLNIPTGVPLVYELNEKLRVKSKKFLMNDKQLIKKQAQIINQGIAK